MPDIIQSLYREIEPELQRLTEKYSAMINRLIVETLKPYTGLFSFDFNNDMGSFAITVKNKQGAELFCIYDDGSISKSEGFYSICDDNLDFLPQYEFIDSLCQDVTELLEPLSVDDRWNFGIYFDIRGKV